MAEDAEAFEPHPQMLADALHSLRLGRGWGLQGLGVFQFMVIF
jgi:hypothetical protein